MNRILLICLLIIAAAFSSAQSVKVESRADSAGNKITKYFILKDGKWVETTADELRKMGINVSANTNVSVSKSGHSDGRKSSSQNSSNSSHHSSSSQQSSSSSHRSGSSKSSNDSQRNSSSQQNRSQDRDSQSVQKLIQSFSREQVAMHDRQGYLTPEDLTPAQRKMIRLPEGRSWMVTYYLDGKRLVLKSR